MLRKNNHTSSLFHYTRRMTALLSIIKEGFKFSYCKEEFMEGICLGIPMISFCDIPIGNCIEHVSKYGSYAIGLSKEALIKTGVEPVNYFISEKNANAAFFLKEVAAEENKIRKRFEIKRDVAVYQKGEHVSTINSPNRQDLDYMLNDFYASNNYYKASISSIGLMKRYSFRNKKGKLQINYDENEWRIVLPEENIKEGGYKWYWSKTEYELWRSKVEDKFVQDCWLTFEVEDINFIIVPKQKDIPTFISKLAEVKQICRKPLSVRNRQLLYSKVISLEQIKDDF